MANSELATFCTGLAAGVAGFPHCLGMCGGFVLYLAQEKKEGGMAGEVQWLLGKCCAYLFLGALAGYAGCYLAGVFGSFVSFQKVMAGVVGAGMVCAALSLLGLLPVRAPGSEGGLLFLCYARVCCTGTPGAPLLLGVATAFLPCPILLALLAHALRLASVWQGMVLMGGLAVGTSLPLLLLAGASRRALPVLGAWLPRLAGTLLLILGLSTALRSTDFFHTLLGCPMKGVLHGTDPGKGATGGTEASNEGGDGR